MDYVYLLRCADGTLYAGWTTDLARRLGAHNSGRGAKYTRSRLPVSLAYWEPCPSRSAALRRERALKRLSRAEKLRLIAGQRGEAPAPAAGGSQQGGVSASLPTQNGGSVRAARPCGRRSGG